MSANNRLEILENNLSRVLADQVVFLPKQCDELTIVVEANNLLKVAKILRDDPELSFDTLIDLCGIDYSTYGDELSAKQGIKGRRFAVIYHLLSVKLNHRVRIRVLAENNELPVISGRLRIGLNARHLIFMALYLPVIRIYVEF